MSCASRQTLASSWALAAEICRFDPALTIYETHPGGGQYDCLSMVRRGVHVDINRHGSLHVLHAPDGASHPSVAPEEWQAMVADEGASLVAERLCAAIGLADGKQRPATTPRVLQYRVIARVLVGRVFETARWDARSAFLDTSGPDDSQIVGWVPSAEMSLIPANELWRLERDHEPVAWLWDGWAWTAGGERVDLMAAYARGARIDDLAATVTQRATARRAASLPEIPGLPRQPVGTWPK